MLIHLVFYTLGAFLLGSIPVGVLIARTRGVDIRKVGSGNIGATNVWRACGPKAGALVFVIDMAKGLIPAMWMMYSSHNVEQAFFVSSAAIIGHSLSPWLGFKGGKGIATGFGVLLGTVPAIALISFAGFLIVSFATRYISLGSIVAAISMGTLGIVFGLPISLKIAFVLFGSFIIYKHRANIVRLRAGTEPKFSLRSKVDAKTDNRDEETHQP